MIPVLAIAVAVASIAVSVVSILLATRANNRYTESVVTALSTTATPANRGRAGRSHRAGSAMTRGRSSR